MNKTKIISDAELKKIGKLSTTDEWLISMHNQIATNTLCDIFGVSELALHTVTDERSSVMENNWVEPIDFPAQADTIVVKNRLKQELTGYTIAQKNNSKRVFMALDSEGRDTILTAKKICLDYTAGWQVRDEITFTGLPSDGEVFTLTDTGEAQQYTFKTTPAGDYEIQIGVTVDETAENTVAKTGGDASGAVATMPLGQTVTSTLSATTVAASGVPAEIKFAVALIAAGSMAKTESMGNVKSYKIGSKQVVFRDDAEAGMAQAIIKEMLATYSSIGIFG